VLGSRECAWTTSVEPGRTLGYLGVQPDAEQSFRFEILTERAKSAPSDPNSGVIADINVMPKPK
jgi:hypothetical protein